MTRTTSRSSAGFTLVEMLVGMSLALMIMTAVLSSYTFLGRSLVRLVNQQMLITQGQRALAYFAQDVRMASGISGTPSDSSLVLILPTSSGTTTTVTYTYSSSSGTLVRAPASGNTLTLLSNLTSSSFTYYDNSGNVFTSTTLGAGSYLISIKQIALSFSAEKGDGYSGTLTPTYQVASSRLLIRNQQFLQ